MSGEWTAQRERANVFALKLLIWTLRLLGRRVAHAVLWPVVGYYVLTSPTARHASRDFLRRVLPRAPHLGDVLRHFHCFAVCSLDRVLLGQDLHGLRVDTQFPAEARIAAQRGCIMLASHFGSFDALRVLGARTHRLPLKILLDRAHGRLLTSLLEARDPQFADSIIDAAQRGPGLVLAMGEALSSGTSIGMMADRVRGDEATLTVDFLGGRARLPAAPWVFASLLKVPVVVAFCIYRGGGHYETRFELIAERIDAPRATRQAVLQAQAQRYARRFEEVARSAPYNWFNFYRYWEA